MLYSLWITWSLDLPLRLCICLFYFCLGLSRPPVTFIVHLHFFSIVTHSAHTSKHPNAYLFFIFPSLCFEPRTHIFVVDILKYIIFLV
ncbi:hypothetical protein BDP27DRAFT_880575 [Rhodocollybia butyracea]|uniref:Uncharacterized protein n=1 Tax=Rhodocollybia butyracea TaxID=206335 RepID=A0A9P5Q7J2_9AGAR|nr:hypothetical protein BDP27DRAFT_880575 [Rhodocollybia butyracea]